MESSPADQIQRHHVLAEQIYVALIAAGEANLLPGGHLPINLVRTLVGRAYDLAESFIEHQAGRPA
jgi:hypothetical protein